VAARTGAVPETVLPQSSSQTQGKSRETEWSTKHPLFPLEISGTLEISETEQNEKEKMPTPSKVGEPNWMS